MTQSALLEWIERPSAECLNLKHDIPYHFVCSIDISYRKLIEYIIMNGHRPKVWGQLQ